MIFEPLYLIAILPGLALSLWASARVESTFARCHRVPAASGLSGAEAAAAMTYVAAAVSAIPQLLYFLWRAGLFGGDSD